MNPVEIEAIATTPMVDGAIASTSWEHYAKEADGELLPQASAAPVIANIVRCAEVRAGHRVLEIGTGSGYSAALLSRIVGAEGRITSIEIVPDLVRRASRRLDEDGVRNVDLHVADGRDGVPSAAPFDRVIAWATPIGAVPRAWADQLAEGGLLLTPTHLAAAAGCIAVAVLTRRDGAMHGVGFVRGSFAPLDREPRHHWRGPLSDDDHVEEDDDGPARWMSAAWVRELGAGDRRVAVPALLDAAVVEDAPPDLAGAGNGLWVSLLVSGPANLTTAYSRGVGLSVGYSGPDGMALLDLAGRQLTRCGDDRYFGQLLAAVENWRQQGQPTLNDLEPVVDDRSDGLDVRAARRRDAELR